MSAPGSQPIEASSSSASSDTVRNAGSAQPTRIADTASRTTEFVVEEEDLSRTPTDRPAPARIVETPASSPAKAAAAAAAAQPGPARPRTSSNMSSSTNPSAFSSPAKGATIPERSEDDEPAGEERFFTPRERIRPGSLQRPRPPPTTLQSSQSRRSSSINATAGKTRPPLPTQSSSVRPRQQRSGSRAGITSAASSAGQGGGGSSGEESEDEEGRPKGRRGRPGPSEDEDDEVETKDRGERLVRKRMRERKVRRVCKALESMSGAYVNTMHNSGSEEGGHGAEDEGGLAAPRVLLHRGRGRCCRARLWHRLPFELVGRSDQGCVRGEVRAIASGPAALAAIVRRPDAFPGLSDGARAAPFLSSCSSSAHGEARHVVRFERIRRQSRRKRHRGRRSGWQRNRAGRGGGGR